MLFKRRVNHPTEEELSAYLDGELASGPMTSISQHLRACEACLAQLENLGAAKAALSELFRLQPSRSFALGPEFARERRRAPQPKRSPFVFAPAVALTAFLALVAVDLSSVSTSMQESGADRLALDSAKSADDAGAPMPATARNSAGQAEGSANVAPPSASHAPGGASGEIQTFGAPSAASPVPIPGQPERTADSPPPRTGAPQAAGEPAALPQADSADGVASSTATQQEEFLMDNYGYDTSDGTNWLRLLQIGAFAAFVVSLVAVGWPLLRSRGRT